MFYCTTWVGGGSGTVHVNGECEDYCWCQCLSLPRYPCLVRSKKKKRKALCCAVQYKSFTGFA